MKTKLLYFAILLFGTLRLAAQSDFQRAYLVTTQNDTLSGWVDYRVGNEIIHRCVFKENENAASISYKPEELSSIHFENGRSLVSKKIDADSLFLEHLFDGCLDVYALRQKNQNDRFFMEKVTIPLSEVVYYERKVEKDGKTFFQASTQHIGLLKYFTSDQPKLHPRIEALYQPDQLSLIQLAKAYQELACEGKAIDAKRNTLPYLKLAAEGVIGGVNYHRPIDFKDNTYFQAGVLLHVWRPRKNEKIFLRTGLFFSNIESANFSTQGILKVPIQVEYIYPHGALRFRASGGINIFFPNYQSVAFSTGCNLKLQESTFLSLNYEVDLRPLRSFPLLPIGVLSNALQLGLFMKL